MMMVSCCIFHFIIKVTLLQLLDICYWYPAVILNHETVSWSCYSWSACTKKV